MRLSSWNGLPRDTEQYERQKIDKNTPELIFDGMN
jgi:hypothetical protein